MDFASELQSAKDHGILSLSSMHLTSVPPMVPSLHTLRRLDLGSNHLRTLPPLGSLRCLQELFLNDNPLCELPAGSLLGCFALRCLDLRRTLLASLPASLSQLPALLDVSTAGAPLEAALCEAGRAGGTPGLLALLRQRHERAALLQALSHRLQQEVWKEAGDTEAGLAALEALVAECSAEFPDNSDLKAVASNAARLFATDLRSASAAQARERFQALRDDNERKALGAELELAMRALYFDAADPRLLARLRAEIVAVLPTVEDARFMVAHARSLLPPQAAHIVPSQLPAIILGLRTRLNAEREAALAMLVKALAAVYFEREPKDIEAMARACASQLARSEDIKSLSADAGELFPAEWGSANPRKVIKAFRESQEDKGLGGTRRGAGK